MDTLDSIEQALVGKTITSVDQAVDGSYLRLHLDDGTSVDIGGEEDYNSHPLSEVGTEGATE